LSAFIQLRLIAHSIEPVLVAGLYLIIFSSAI